jgi:hypothetical protein
MGSETIQPVKPEWRNTGISIQPRVRPCIDVTTPNTLISIEDDDVVDGGLVGTTYTYNWLTGNKSFLTNQPAAYCSPDGWYYSSPAIGKTIYRFRLDNPLAQPIDRLSLYAPAPNGVTYVYEAATQSEPSPLWITWASSDDGATWDQHTHMFGGDIESFTVAQADSRVVYALIKNETPPPPRRRNYTIHASTDAGYTWERRAEGQTPNDHYGGNLFRYLYTVEGSATPVDMLRLVISYGSIAPHDSTFPWDKVEVFLSGDGGRSFQLLGTTSETYAWQLIHTHQGLLRLDQYYTGSGRSKPILREQLRLSTDGGRTWQELPQFPALTPERSSTGQLFLAPDLPSSVFAPRYSTSSSLDKLLYSPDGGYTWREFDRKTDNYYLASPYLPLTVLGIQDSVYSLELPEAARYVSAPTVRNNAPSGTYFPQTGHNLGGAFKDYWEQNGGLAQQGYPITEPFREVSDTDGKVYKVQYFERAVMELHPENDSPNNVLLSLLGSHEYGRKYPGGAPKQRSNNQPGSVFFPETGKRLGGTFLRYWLEHGGLRQQGLPVSDEFTEVSPLDGKPYTVQYFERAVFEMHPENAGTHYEVLLSQLGTFRLREKFGSPTLGP